MFEIKGGQLSWKTGRGIFSYLSRFSKTAGADYGCKNLTKIPVAACDDGIERPSRIKKFKEFKVPGTDKPA